MRLSFEFDFNLAMSRTSPLFKHQDCSSHRQMIEADLLESPALMCISDSEVKKKENRGTNGDNGCAEAVAEQPTKSVLCGVICFVETSDGDKR